jgi:phosphogluconate dehydratase
MQKAVLEVTERIVRRSAQSRSRYLRNMDEGLAAGPTRHRMPASNLAHAMAVTRGADRERMLDQRSPHIAIVTSYSDLVSAHQSFETYPAILKRAVAAAGGVAQVAGGVPGMCDGVIQGEPGMDISLVSRDVIAMATVMGVGHNVFDGALLLGTCDKILPGLLMGALQFGHLPMLFVPGGPMRSGLPNKEKAHARELFAEGKIGAAEMLDVECRCYHSTGTCTFYGTANSNQLVAELMGLNLPGASFVNPDDPLREALTAAAGARVAATTHLGEAYAPIGRVVSEKSVVNAIVGVLATGGSTNQTMHLVAIARAAGIRVTWDDFSDLAAVVPLLVRIYPNGPGDINAFQQAGGMAALVAELLDGGLVHDDVPTVAGRGLEAYTRAPVLAGGALAWKTQAERSSDHAVIAPLRRPFSPTGGLKVLSGNLGRAVIKVSSLADGPATVVEAPAMVFHTQEELAAAFRAGRLNRDLVAVVRFQGPRATGMPELHKLITPLSIVMDHGHRVAMVTDGRLSGASGKVPAAIHVTPEALCGGLLAKVRDGDVIRVDVGAGRLELLLDDATLAARDYADPGVRDVRYGFGRQIFAPLRGSLQSAEAGASSIFTYVHEKCDVHQPFEEE